MQDQHTGQAGTFIVDPEVGIRIPAEHLDVYQADKSAYLADPDAAVVAFKAQPAKKSAQSKSKEQ